MADIREVYAGVEDGLLVVTQYKGMCVRAGAELTAC